jgi:hypothetical protein
MVSGIAEDSGVGIEAGLDTRAGGGLILGAEVIKEIRGMNDMCDAIGVNVGVSAGESEASD